MTAVDVAISAGTDTIDFTRSLPPQPARLAAAIDTALSGLLGSGAAAALLRAASAGGDLADRRAAANWLEARFGEAIDPDRVVMTSGTQTSFLLVARYLVEPGGVVLAEALSWKVLRDLADQARIRLIPVELDEEGMRPDALAAVCGRERPALLYCNPTHHNPTTATMSIRRRREIAAVAREHGVAIFEDDVAGTLDIGGPPPLATVAPDITWYSMGLTKCLAQGLRVGYLVGPDVAHVARLRDRVGGLSHWVAHPVAAHVVRHWIATGEAVAIAAAIRDEAMARQQLARAHLPATRMRTRPDSLHLWLRTPDGRSPLDYSRAAADAGVLVRPADQFSLDGRPCGHHVRLALGAPSSRDMVRRGLQRLAALDRPFDRPFDDGETR